MNKLTEKLIGYMEPLNEATKQGQVPPFTNKELIEDDDALALLASLLINDEIWQVLAETHSQFKIKTLKDKF